MSRLEIKHEYMKKAAREGFSPFYELTAFNPLVDLLNKENAVFICNNFHKALQFVRSTDEFLMRNPEAAISLAEEDRDRTVVYLFSEGDIESEDFLFMFYQILNKKLTNLLPVMIEVGMGYHGQDLSQWLPLFYNKHDGRQTSQPYVRYYADINEGLDDITPKEALTLIPDDRLIKRWYKNMQKIEAGRDKLLQQTRDNILKKQNEDKKQKTS